MMKKCKLPKDWITVNSKSHPDRVYYFNVKTNQSTWRQPTSDKTDMISLKQISNRHRNYEEEVRSRATTPEHNGKEDKVACQPQSLRNKRLSQMAESAKKVTMQEKETAQMKALREKMLQRKLQKPGIKNKLSNVNEEHVSTCSPPKNSSKLTENNEATVLLSKRSCLKLAENNKTTSLSLRSSSSKLTGNDKPSTSLARYNNKTTTLTPQMRVLYEKIQQKKLATSESLEKKARAEPKSRQVPVNANQTLTETWEKQNNIANKASVGQNKNNVKSVQINQEKKNIAKERMQKLRKSLQLEKEKLEKICTITTDKSSQKSLNRKSLPISYYKGNLGSTNIYKNVEVRLKRLHNKILKDTLYEKNATLNNNNSQIQREEPVIDKKMTKETLIEQANREILYEEMDWEPMKDEEITLEVEVVRTQLNMGNRMDVMNCIPENAIQLTQSSEVQEKNPLYIVIDTNVFLSNLEIIEEARDATFKNYPRPFIVIPWTVIRELDYLKDDKSRPETLRMKARKAISFLNEHFLSKHPRIVGQTREQAEKNKEDFSLECPDDEILQCCLQIRELRKSVVLLSYDKNLCTKAMIYDIVALGRDDPLEKVDYLHSSNKVNLLTNKPVKHTLLDEELQLSDDIFENTKAAMRDFLSAIIVKQMLDIYGSDWEIYVIIKPPWTVVTALKCAIKHWIAAISEAFHRRSLYIVKELLEAFERLPVGGRKLQDVEHILERCSDLIQTVNTDRHYEQMAQVFNVITELKKKCLKHIADIDQKKLHDKIGITENIQEQEQRAEKAIQCFKQIYSYARDLCGVAASIVGIAFPLNFNPLNPPLPHTTVKHLQPEITKKVNDLAYSLNKLLEQAENSIKYQTLLILQQNLNTFFTHTETIMFDVELLDIYYCVKLKEDVLKMGLRQLQELNTHYCALTTYT